jgi:hypothetical protein
MNEVTREEDLDDEAFQIKHVFATFGLASYQAQVLENGLANVLTVARTHSEAGTQDAFRHRPSPAVERKAESSSGPLRSSATT